MHQFLKCRSVQRRTNVLLNTILLPSCWLNVQPSKRGIPDKGGHTILPWQMDEVFGRDLQCFERAEWEVWDKRGRSGVHRDVLHNNIDD